MSKNQLRNANSKCIPSQTKIQPLLHSASNFLALAYEKNNSKICSFLLRSLSTEAPFTPVVVERTD